jgi:hypothetical protein
MEPYIQTNPEIASLFKIGFGLKCGKPKISLDCIFLAVDFKFIRCAPLLEPFGYRWFRVGGLDYLLKRTEI